MAETFQQVSTHEDAPTPEAGTQEHQNAMVRLAEEAGAVAREDNQPAWLPDKFESPEAMAKAYHELETKLSSNSESVTNSDEVSPPPQTPLPNQEEHIQEAKTTLTNAGVDFNKYANEFTQNGELSDQSYTELNAAGIGNDMINSWVQGQDALTDQVQQSAYNAVGGEESYGNLVKWAGETLPQNEIDSFNRALESPNKQDGLFAIKSLHAQYQLANASGSSPNLLQGSTGRSGSDGFTSLSQMSEAMRDPKYQNDPAFRKEVTRKLEASNLM
tara:strand:+ start:2226 stop:3044 length:819 start_codon:yes stop_codon:yes gene_type:complete